MSLGAAKAAMLGAAGAAAGANPDLGNFTLAGLVSVAATLPQSVGVYLKSDGTEMYLLDTGTRFIYTWTLSTPFDITTAAYSGVSYDFYSNTGTLGLNNLSLTPDGTRLAVTQQGSNGVSYGTLSTPWSVPSFVFEGTYATADSVPKGMVYSADGTSAFVVHLARIREYTLSTPYDWGSTVGVGGFYDFSVETSLAAQAAFSQDGTKMWLLEDGSTAVNNVYQYTLSTPWDPTTATYDGVSLDVGASESAPLGMFLTADMANLYITGKSSDVVLQYDTGT